jgi:hypothetical protein
MTKGLLPGFRRLSARMIWVSLTMNLPSPLFRHAKLYFAI